ncbi:MAG: tetratricopeptide repeat protein [Verrucomicrobiota bacterium]
MPTEPVSDSSIELTVFWIEHKKKILTYVAVIAAALACYGLYAFFVQQRTAAAQDLFAKASSDADLQAVISKFSGTRIAGNAALELADKLRSEKKYDEAVVVLRNFIEKYPKHPLASGAWTSLAATYELQGKPDEALDTYQQALSKYPDDYTAPLAMMSQARIKVAQNKKEEARRLYQDVTARFPDSPFAREAMRELRFLKN